MHIHWHKVVEYRGQFAYMQCRCGHRTVHRVGGGMEQADMGWVETGEFTMPKPAILPPLPEGHLTVLDLEGEELTPELVFTLHQRMSREERRRFAELVAGGGVPAGVPLDQTTAPVHYEGDTSST